MGQSTNGILAYGYDLGGTEGYKVREVGEYGELQLDWYDEDENADFAAAVERRLLDASGFTETWEDGHEGYFGREREAKQRLGMELYSYCSDDYPMYLLATKVITVYRGEIETIDMGELAEAPSVHGWDDKLRAALETLGLTPTQDRARWLLASYWG